eukprot:scaffold13199_cov62-Attheya_sp.AAC.10
MKIVKACSSSSTRNIGHLADCLDEGNIPGQGNATKKLENFYPSSRHWYFASSVWSMSFSSSLRLRTMQGTVCSAVPLKRLTTLIIKLTTITTFFKNIGILLQPSTSVAPPVNDNHFAQQEADMDMVLPDLKKYVSYLDEDQRKLQMWLIFKVSIG